MTGINRSAALRLRGLLCGAAMAAIVCATTALAQDEAGATEAEAPSAAIVVTRSRIRADGMQAPTPVTVVDAEAIETLSPGPIITGISQLPQFYGNQTPNAGAGFFNRSGYGALNLRDEFGNRTLTLLNGRRMPSSTAFGGVDVNMFPEAMISSVETTTGGASAAYGSDAVAGVVNFMLDTNFTGLELSAQGGITDRGDNEQYELSASYGMELGDRGHLLVSGEYADQNGVFSYKGRDWYQSWSTFGAGTSTSPYTFLPHVISSNGSFDGIIISPNAAINGLSFDRNGAVVPFNRGTTTQGAIGTPASRHVLANGVSGDDLGAEVTSLYPDLDRYSAFAYADYEVTDSVKVFAQFLRGRTHTFQYNAPRGGFLGQPTTITIFADNAYLPQSLKTTMANNNIASFTLRRSGSLQDVGTTYLDDTTTQNIATAGFEADLSTGGMLDGWNVSGYYQYGNSQRDWRQQGLRVDRLFAAVDAVRDSNNNIVCRVSTFTAGAAAFPGCKPVNLFGRGGGLTPTPEGYDYIVGFEPGQTITTPIYYADTGFALGDTETFNTTETKDALTTFTQNFAELSASGDLVEGWAGTISMALGGSWRRDHIRQIVHDVTNPSSNHTNPSPKPVLCNSTTLGLRGVSNPLPAGGAQDPERLEDARRNAPLTLRTFERVVSLSDYQDFARAFPGIGKARADLVSVAGAPRVLVSVLGATGGAPGAEVLDNLRQAITDQSDPAQHFALAAAALRHFRCTAALVIDPQYTADAVLAEGSTRLLQAYGFEARDLAQPVTAAALLALLQQVPGVLAVQLTVLQPYGAGTSAEIAQQVLPAFGAHWDAAAGAMQPAELLLLNPAAVQLLETKP